MMFTEGLDENAINWVKQGVVTEQRTRSPLAVRTTAVPMRDPHLFHDLDAAYPSPNRLPPLKFHSGLWGTRSSVYDVEDDRESVGSATNNVINMDLSDSFEDGLGSGDSDLHNEGYDDEVRSNCTKGATLLRSAPTMNLKVDINSRCYMGSSNSYGQQHIGHVNSSDDLMNRIMTPPSAPPIMENGSRFIADERFMPSANLDECLADEAKEIAEGHIPDERKSVVNEVRPETGTRVESSTGLFSRSISKEREALNQHCQISSLDKVACYSASGQSAWQTFVAYDACFRLCLNAWARDCMEAPEFLRAECEVLKKCIRKYLLQPKGEITREVMFGGSEDNYGMKEKKVVGEIKVEVKKIRTIPRRKLQTASSQRTLYMQVGAQYIRNVSNLLKSGINSLKVASFPIVPEETMSCYIWLQSSTPEKQEPEHSSCLQPGAGDSYTFYPTSQADALVVEVRDSNKVAQGQTIIQISSLIDTLVRKHMTLAVDNLPMYVVLRSSQYTTILLYKLSQTDRVQWWPLYVEDNECVGKVQLSISFASTSGQIKSVKSGPAVETIVYDLVLEAAMRALHFHKRNLHISGSWKWLLDEFADYYGVSDAYTRLRYLSFIMNAATPTKYCLELVYELLLPVIEARGSKGLTRQEGSLLLDCEAQVERLLATTFSNYKSLNELSPTGIGDEHDLHGPSFDVAAPALVPAVQIYTLLHDILSPEAQTTLKNYLQTAAAKRCRLHMIETDEFMNSNQDGLTDPMIISTAYLKMKSLCMNISSEIQADIKIHNQHVLPSSIDLPNIAASVYSTQLCKRLVHFLKVCPPSKPSQHVTELLIATADFERDLQSWNISPVHGGLISRDLFDDYITVWIEDMKIHLMELCKGDKVPWSGTQMHYSTSPFVENMYDHLRVAISEYEIVMKRWPHYLIHLESTICDVEHAILKALEKQYSDILAPLRESIPKILEKHVQKFTRRQAISIYVIPDQLGIFLNTVKRMLDVLHAKVEDIMRSWGTILMVIGDSKMVYGEQMNSIVVMLRKKYKTYVQAIVEKLVSNTQTNRSTRLKKILEETKDAEGEMQIRERMQPLCSQLIDAIHNLHNVFSSRIFITLCHAFWDRMGQIVLNFLERRKENRIWYKASGHALGILDDLFASQMQTLQGNSLQEKDLDPPRSIIEARSILC